MRLFAKIISISLIVGLFIVLLPTKMDFTAEAAKPRYTRLKQLIEESEEISQESIKETSKILKTTKKTKTRVVTFKEKLSEDEIKKLESVYGLKFSSKKSRHGRYVVTPSSETKLAALEENENVEKITNNDIYTISAQSTDWGVEKINAPAAWSYVLPTTGSSIIVAVIDTGVQLDHPDLVGAIQSGGYDYVSDDSVPEDDNGHGTHVAGIIAATNNSVGTVGISYNTKILPMRVCSTVGETTSCGSVAIADAIQDSIDADVDVINLSLGGSANELIQAAINDATTAGIIVVAAAGNSNSGGCLYPAAYENVVCVGATNESDAKASYSNYGIGLDVVAPGDNIQSLGLSSTYTSLSGTSMATAHYSGAAALVASMLKNFCTVDPSNTVCDDIRSYTQMLINDVTIRDIGTPGTDSQFGKGIVDLSQLFTDTIPNHTAPTALITKGVTYSQPITLTNSNSYAIALSSCTITSNNVNRVQTVPAFTTSNFLQGVTSYSSPTLNGIYTTYTFSTPIPIDAGNTINFSYNYSPSSETVPNDYISYSFICTFDRTGTETVESYRSEPAALSTKVDLPTTLKNVYFTFTKLKYNQRVSASQLMSNDTLYLKNFNTSQLKLLQVFLYDYVKKGNQGITKSNIKPTSFNVRTNYRLPGNRKYAYVAKIQDKATGIIVTKYFVFYTK